MSSKMVQVFRIYWLILLIVCLQIPAWAQKDSTVRRRGVEAFLKRQKGMMGKLASNLVSDSIRKSDQEIAPPLRNDLSFRGYENRVIRNITIERLDFGTLINDTTHTFKNKFTRLANTLHHKSREYVIRNNLFFKAGDRVQSYLMADNERHLRDQPYVQDARILIEQSEGSFDSVDVVVRVKDVLSLGGSFELHNMRSAEISLREDNLDGWGNTISVGTLYNQDRRIHSGLAGQYIVRNIGGSFIDGSVGVSNYATSFSSGRKEEQVAFIRFIKPLVNPYTKWTFSLEAANHITDNLFLPDSLYNSDTKYHYYNYDAFVGWNTGAYNLTGANSDNRLRTLVSLRYFKQLFLTIPGKYDTQYYYSYADMTGILGSVSLFKQNFYKTQYFYGFGRNEDVPEGTAVSLTAGWIDKQQKNRPYAGIAAERYYFAPNKGYYDFILRAGGYWADKRTEDVSMLLAVTHYSRLVNVGANWKQRSQVNASITGQVNQLLNPAVWLQSPYGLDEWKNSLSAAGDFRATLRAETVFFSPYTFVNFHFAFFAFGNLSMITPVKQNIDKSNLYSSIGGGIRTRNESLIFGTFELKAYYYPRKTFTGDTWRIETNTGIKFKYNNQTVLRPDVINVN